MKKLIIFCFAILFFTISGNAQTIKANPPKTVKTKTIASINSQKAKAKIRKLKLEMKKDGE